MGGIVYLLCAATALACSVLLFRGYARSWTRLLLWCGVFFLFLAVENVILFIDRQIVPGTDLLHLRRSFGLIGVLVLLYGLVWEGMPTGTRGGAGWTR